MLTFSCSVAEEQVRNISVTTLLGSLALLLVATLPAATVAAVETPVRGNQGRTWSAIAHLPDWQGAWTLDRSTFERGVQTVTNPYKNAFSAPLNAKWEAYRQSNAAANGGQGPATGTRNNATKCLPDGMPALMSAPHDFMFLFQPGLVVIISNNGEHRVVYTDGRAHPADPDETWDGHSTGHWQGDTLVIDTIAIKPAAEIFMGMPNASSRTHVVERIRLDPKDKKLHLQVAVTNPDQFTAPFEYENSFDHLPGGMSEYVCLENNRDTDRGETDLGPRRE
jgi:hypothetical protein